MAGDLGGQRGLDDLPVEPAIGVQLHQLVQRGDDAHAQDRVAGEQALHEHGLRGRGANRLQGGGQLVAGRRRSVGIDQSIANRADHTVAHPAERLDDRLGERRLLDAVDDPMRELPLAEQAGRTDRFVRDVRGIVLEQLAQLAVEHVGHDANHPRRLDPAALPFFPRLGHHPLQQQLRRLEVLGAAGPGQERDHRAADREVREVAELLDERQRVGVGVPRHVEQRFGPHLEARVVQQLLHLAAHRHHVRRSTAARSRACAPPATRGRASPGTAGCTTLADSNRLSA